MLEKIQYLAVEGVIGVGKTSLVEILSKKFFAGKMMEKLEENPFLEKFYKTSGRNAFQVQLWFLLSRYRQIKEFTAQHSLFHQTIIADFMFAKDKIFAYTNLDDDELMLYNKISEPLEQDLLKPDYIIYLQASTDVLMERIAQRGRPYEKNMSRQYIEELNKAYNHFFFHYSQSPLLIINTNDIDFVHEESGLDEIVRQMDKHKSGTQYFHPMNKQ